LGRLNINYREDSTWELKREGAKRASKTFDKKSEAVEEGERFLAEKDDIDRLVIHNRKGAIVTQKKLDKKSKAVKTLSKDDQTYQKWFTHNDYQLPYVAWKKEYVGEPLTTQDQGCRIQLAGTNTTEKNYLYKVHEKGTPGWPEGGYTIRRRDLDYTTDHFMDEVRLHKSEKKKR
jgi:hypothetical protein